MIYLYFHPLGCCLFVTLFFEVVVRIDTNTSYQSLFGFGGAFTDAAAINIANLSSGAANYVIDSYYGPQGKRLMYLMFTSQKELIPIELHVRRNTVFPTMYISLIAPPFASP